LFAKTVTTREAELIKLMAGSRKLLSQCLAQRLDIGMEWLILERAAGKSNGVMRILQVSANELFRSLVRLTISWEPIMSEKRITQMVGLALGGLFAFGLLLNALAL